MISEPPKKRPKTSKNKKSYQRKIDVSSIQDAAQQKEAEIRAHGQPVSEKADNELFKIDSQPMKSNELVKNLKVASSSKKERYRNKQSMIDRILNPATSQNVKPIYKDRSHVNKTKQDQIKSLSKRGIGLPPKIYKVAEKTGNYDLWDEQARADTFSVNLPKRVDAKGIGHGTKKYTKSSAKMTSKNFGTDVERKIKIISKFATECADNETATDVKRKLKSHALPHPGQSYQPDLVQHQDLLKGEHQKIVAINDKLAKIERDVSWDKSNVATVESDFKEKAEGLFEEEEDWEDIQLDLEDDSAGEDELKYADNLPKSERAKKKVKAEMEKRKEINKMKKLRHQEAQIYNTKRIIKEIKETKSKNEATKIKNLISEAGKFPRLSSTKFSEADKEIKLSDEIKPSLRQLVPEGDILSDRYQQFIRRGIIEPHTVHKGKYKKKYKTKLRVKRSVKNLLGIEGINDI